MVEGAHTIKHLKTKLSYGSLLFRLYFPSRVFKMNMASKVALSASLWSTLSSQVITINDKEPRRLIKARCLMPRSNRRTPNLMTLIRGVSCASRLASKIRTQGRDLYKSEWSYLQMLQLKLFSRAPCHKSGKLLVRMLVSNFYLLSKDNTPAFTRLDSSNELKFVYLANVATLSLTMCVNLLHHSH